MNSEWRLLYPNAVVTYLTTFHFDHQPILINIAPPSSNRPWSFKFDAMSTRDDSAAVIIENAWIKGLKILNFSHLITKLKNTKLALKE